MKLLIVFLSTLVLAAQSYVASSDEVVAGYAAVDGPEADAVGSPGIFAEEAEPWVGSPQDRAAERVSALETGVNIPIVTRACNAAACANICHRLGFIFGICINANTCQCRNR